MNDQQQSRADALTEAVTHTIETIKRQLDLIADRAPSNFLDKRSVVQSLTAHVRRLEKALAASPVEQPALLTAQDALAAIETFEIVGDNNDSREPNAEDRFILTEFVAHLFGGFRVEQPAAPPIVSAPVSDARECLMDVVSHHQDFVTACKSIKGELHACGAHDSAAYWQKQIDVLDRMKAQAERALATSANETGAEGAADEAALRKSMQPEQIRLERKLTCEAIDGAMAFGYQNTNPPPSDDHWLAPYWKIGRLQAEVLDTLHAIESDLLLGPHPSTALAAKRARKLIDAISQSAEG